MNLARRAARFTKNRQDLDNHEARKAAERVAADKQKDDILRAKLDGLASGFYYPSLDSLILNYYQTTGCARLRKLREKSPTD